MEFMEFYQNYEILSVCAMSHIAVLAPRMIESKKFEPLKKLIQKN